MTISIKGGPLTKGVTVTDMDTGAELQAINSIDIRIRPDSTVEASVDFPLTELDLKAELSAVPATAAGVLTKRELFAAMAMQGFIASKRLGDPFIAAEAVKQADWLMAELEAKQ